LPLQKTTGLSAIASNISAERTFPAESPKKHRSFYSFRMSSLLFQLRTVFELMTGLFYH
jgi:hypothetical protein